MICQRATTGENHPIGAGSGAGTLQPGETVSLHRPKRVPKQQERTLMFKHLWVLWGCFCLQFGSLYFGMV